MLVLKIEVEGKTLEELDQAVEEISKKLKATFLAGSDSNENKTSYHFNVTGEPEYVYTLLVENIGWVVSEEEEITDRAIVDDLFQKYIVEGASQVTLWRSDYNDPIREYNREDDNG